MFFLQRKEKKKRTSKMHGFVFEIHIETAYSVKGACPSSKIVHLPAVTDDPQRRKPDISRAKERLGWEPRFPVLEGLRETVAYFRRTLEEGQAPLTL